MTTDPEAPAAALPGAGEAAARGGALRSVGFALSAVLSLVTVPLMVRHLGVVRFGRWVSVLALVNVVGLAAELGLTQIALREYPLRGPAERRRLLAATFGLRLLIVALGTVVALVFALIAGWPSVMVEGVLVASVALFIGSWQDAQSVRLSAELRFRAVTAAEVARAAATAVTVAVLVVIGAGLAPFFGVYIVGTAAAVAVGAAALRGGGRIQPRFRRTEWQLLWRDAGVYAVATAAYVVYFRAVMIVTSIVATAVQAGYFATAFRVTEFAVAVPGVLAATVLPLLAHAAAHERDRFELGVSDVVRLGLVAGVGAALVLVLAAPTIMDVLGGDKAAPAAPVLRIQAIAVATSFFAFGTGVALLALRRHKELLVVNLVALVCAVALAVVLANSDGARGAAVAAVIGECVLVAGQLVALTRVVRIADLPRTALIVALATAAAVAVFVLLPVPNVPGTIAAVALYAVIVVARGQLPPHVRAVARFRTG